MSYDFDYQPQQMSGGAKVAIGCGAAAFLVVALLCGGFLFVGYLAIDKADELVQQVEKAAGKAIEELQKQVDTFAARFEAEGYQRVTGQVVEIDSDIEHPTVYTVQVFTLNADSAGSLAVMAQAAEINGTINGDLHFYGQSLTIRKEAVITGNLYVRFAQAINNQGTVKGDIVEDDRLDLDATATPEETSAEEEAMEDEATRENATDGVVKPSPGDVIESQESTDEPAAAEADENEATPRSEDPQPSEDTPTSEDVPPSDQ